MLARVPLEAIHLGRQPGHSSRSVAIDLGISSESLRCGVIQADADHGASPDLTTDELSELTKLRRENRSLPIEGPRLPRRRCRDGVQAHRISTDPLETSRV
jgi:transposase-like protein